uniref:Uncharacterized protein n=1 Tax=Trichuris muris TaxID=70415 RepID=A0A5S6R541_TRIMR
MTENSLNKSVGPCLTDVVASQCVLRTDRLSSSANCTALAKGHFRLLFLEKGHYDRNGAALMPSGSQVWYYALTLKWRPLTVEPAVSCSID